MYSLLKPKYIAFLILLFILVGCQKNDNSSSVVNNSDTIWLKMPYQIYKGDSAKFVLYNQFISNTVKDNEDRLTTAFFTDKDISKEELEIIAEEKETKILQELEFRAAEITEKDSLIFYYIFPKIGKYYLSGFIEDRMFISENEKSTKGLVKQQKKFFKINFEVENKIKH